MDLPETLAFPRAKQKSQHLQPGRVKFVHSRRLVGVGGDDRIQADAGRGCAHARRAGTARPSWAWFDPSMAAFEISRIEIWNFGLERERRATAKIARWQFLLCASAHFRGLTEANRRWWTLAGACMGLFVLMLDSTVINVALPDIARDLDATTAGLQWVMNAYLLVLAAFVVSAGRLGDVLGRRRVFVVGMSAFAGGSVVAALSGSEDVLVAGRVLQGVGGAALLGLSLAIVSTVFPAGERARALGIWAGVSALALGLGPLLGGALVEAVSWRWLFWMNLPFCLLGVVLVLASTAEQRDQTAARRIDVAGVITVGLGLAAIVIALVEGKTWGWTSLATLGVFAAGVGLLVGFWLIEHHVRSPIVEFDLFRNGPYFGASAAGFCLVGCYWALMFLQPQYLQTDLGHGALEAGVLILPVTAPMIAISPLGGRLIGLRRPRRS